MRSYDASIVVLLWSSTQQGYLIVGQANQLSQTDCTILHFTQHFTKSPKVILSSDAILFMNLICNISWHCLASATEPNVVVGVCRLHAVGTQPVHESTDLSSVVYMAIGVDPQKSRGTGSRPEWVPFPFLPFLSPLILSLPLPFPPLLLLSLLPLPLEVGPLNPTKGSGGTL